MIRIPSAPNRDIRTLSLGEFRGVDFSTSPMKAAKNRGVAGTKNFIWQNGINHRRQGWRQLAKLSGHINGVYPFTDTTEKFLVYAGTTFSVVEFTNTSLGFTATDVDDSAIDPLLLEDQKVQFFEQDGRTFIVGCGDYLVWHKPSTTWILERVADSDITFIPTTSISLDYVGFAGPSRTGTLWRPNLMTTWQKNTGRSNIADVNQASYTFYLDSLITINSEVIVTIETIHDDAITTHTLTNSGVDKTVLYEGAAVLGSIDWYGDDNGHSGITIATTIEWYAADDNITFQFHVTQPSAFTSDCVTTSKFASLFGVEGVTTQLFMAGNDDLPNTDYFSYPLDFTYFPDNNYRSVGNSAITGYIRLADGVQMIFKDNSYGEAAVYIRTGTYVANEQTLENDTIFTERAGYSDKALIARDSIRTLANDPLYLTRYGICGITLSSNVATDQRFARERSEFIDTALRSHGNGLADATAIVYDNRYYLAVDDVCYIADARFKSSAEDDMDDTFNYEWWYWTNIPAHIFFEHDGDLYFGTENGAICIFDDIREDRSFATVSQGNMVIEPATDTVTYNPSLVLAEDGKSVRLDEPDLYDLIFDYNNDVYSIVADRITIKESATHVAHLQYLNIGDAIRLVGNTESAHTDCFIHDIDLATRYIELEDANGDPINVATICTTKMWVMKSLEWTELWIVQNDDDTDTFRLSRSLDGNPIALIFHYTAQIDDLNTGNSFTAILITHTELESLWVTPFLDGGTNAYGKTLYSITTQTEPAATGDLAVGYETRNLVAEGEFGGFDTSTMTELSLAEFSLSNLAASFTKRIKAKNINYFYFWLRSVGTADTVIVGLSCEYSISTKNRGAR